MTERTAHIAIRNDAAEGVVDKTTSPLPEIAPEEWHVCISIDDNGRDRDLVFGVTPYERKDVFRLLDKLGMRFRTSDDGGDVVDQVPDHSACTPFFYKHLHSVSGLSRRNPKREEIRRGLRRELGSVPSNEQIEEAGGGHIPLSVVEAAEWVKKNPGLGIPELVVMAAYGSITFEGGDNSDDEDDAGLLLVDDDRPLHLYGHVPIWDVETGRRRKCEFSVAMLRETAHMERRYAQATRGNKIRRKTRSWRRNQDYETIYAIGREMLQEIDGFAHDGNPCTAETRDEWIDAVPAWWVIECAVQRFQHSADLKN